MMSGDLFVARVVCVARSVFSFIDNIALTLWHWAEIKTNKWPSQFGDDFFLVDFSRFLGSLQPLVFGLQNYWNATHNSIRGYLKENRKPSG